MSVTQDEDGLEEFYATPEQIQPGEPGQLIKVQTLESGDIQGSLFRIMYHSRSVADEDIAVTGSLAVPNTPAPIGGRPVVTLGHPTVGNADECAPSRDPSTSAAVINRFLAAGWIVATSDYEGLGTPGVPPYLVGESEGRSMVDIVRAARTIPALSAGTTFAAWLRKTRRRGRAPREQHLQGVGLVGVVDQADLPLARELPGQERSGCRGVRLVDEAEVSLEAIDDGRVRAEERRSLRSMCSSVDCHQANSSSSATRSSGTWRTESSESSGSSPRRHSSVRRVGALVEVVEHLGVGGEPGEHAHELVHGERGEAMGVGRGRGSRRVRRAPRRRAARPRARRRGRAAPRGDPGVDVALPLACAAAGCARAPRACR